MLTCVSSISILNRYPGSIVGSAFISSIPISTAGSWPNPPAQDPLRGNNPTNQMSIIPDSVPDVASSFSDELVCCLLFQVDVNGCPVPVNVLDSKSIPVGDSSVEEFENLVFSTAWEDVKINSCSKIFHLLVIVSIGDFRQRIRTRVNKVSRLYYIGMSNNNNSCSSVLSFSRTVWSSNWIGCIHRFLSFVGSAVNQVRRVHRRKIHSRVDWIVTEGEPADGRCRRGWLTWWNWQAGNGITLRNFTRRFNLFCFPPPRSRYLKVMLWV